jgi:hypothetical protein
MVVMVGIHVHEGAPARSPRIVVAVGARTADGGRCRRGVPVLLHRAVRIFVDDQPVLAVEEGGNRSPCLEREPPSSGTAWNPSAQ